MWLTFINNAREDINNARASINNLARNLDAVGLNKPALQLWALADILEYSNEQIEHAVHIHTVESLKQAQRATASLLSAIVSGAVTIPKDNSDSPS